ncbi:MAG TPA: hypothetical protein VI756_27225 [Blastocatellia bacterium]
MEIGRKTGSDSSNSGSDTCEVADLLEWKHKRRHSDNAPLRFPDWSEKLRCISRKEKQAILLVFLLSDGTRDDQLDAMIDAVMNTTGGGSDV